MLISYYANKKSSPRLPSWQPSLFFFNIPIESGSIIKPCTLKHFQVTYRLDKAGYWTNGFFDTDHHEVSLHFATNEAISEDQWQRNNSFFCPTLIEQIWRLNPLKKVSKVSDSSSTIDMLAHCFGALSKVRAIGCCVIGLERDLVWPEGWGLLKSFFFRSVIFQDIGYPHNELRRHLTNMNVI